MNRPLTNEEIALSKTAQLEDENRERIREKQHWRTRYAQIEEIASRQGAERTKDHPADRDSALVAFDKRNPDIIGHPGAKIRAFQGYEQLKERASKGESFDWHTELTSMEKNIRQEVGWTKTEEEEKADILSEMRKSRGQE